MSSTQWMGALFLLVGVGALVLRSRGRIPESVAGDGVAMLAGISCLIVGALFFLLGWARTSMEYHH